MEEESPDPARRGAMETGWWDEAFAPLPYRRSPPGEKKMLTVIAYDIADPRRLARVSRMCEDYGMRVQYSVFECFLESEQLDELWSKLEDELNPEEDRLVAYLIDAKSAKKTRTAGAMVCSERVVCYLV